MDDITLKLGEIVTRGDLSKYNEEQTELFDLKLKSHKNEIKAMELKISELKDDKENYTELLSSFKKRFKTLETELKDQIEKSAVSINKESDTKIALIRKSTVNNEEIFESYQKDLKGFTKKTITQLENLKLQYEDLLKENTQLKSQISDLRSSIKGDDEVLKKVTELAVSVKSNKKAIEEFKKQKVNNDIEDRMKNVESKIMRVEADKVNTEQMKNILESIKIMQENINSLKETNYAPRADLLAENLNSDKSVEEEKVYSNERILNKEAVKEEDLFNDDAKSESRKEVLSSQRVDSNKERVVVKEPKAALNQQLDSIDKKATPKESKEQEVELSEDDVESLFADVINNKIKEPINTEKESVQETKEVNNLNDALIDDLLNDSEVENNYHKDIITSHNKIGEGIEEEDKVKEVLDEVTGNDIKQEEKNGLVEDFDDPLVAGPVKDVEEKDIKTDLANAMLDNVSDSEVDNNEVEDIVPDTNKDEVDLNFNLKSDIKHEELPSASEINQEEIKKGSSDYDFFCSKENEIKEQENDDIEGFNEALVADVFEDSASNKALADNNVKQDFITPFKGDHNPYIPEQPQAISEYEVGLDALGNVEEQKKTHKGSVPIEDNAESFKQVYNERKNSNKELNTSNNNDLNKEEYQNGTNWKDEVELPMTFNEALIEDALENFDYEDHKEINQGNDSQVEKSDRNENVNTDRESNENGDRNFAEAIVADALGNSKEVKKEVEQEANLDFLEDFPDADGMSSIYYEQSTEIKQESKRETGLNNELKNEGLDEDLMDIDF